SASYSYGGRASEAIKSFAAGPTNHQIDPWTPSGFSATDTVIRVVAQDSRGASQPFNSPAFTVDSAPPTILSFSPAAGASQVDRHSLIQANWSEPVNEATTAAALGRKDTGGIATVTAASQGPGRNQNVSMTHASGARWYVNRSYSAAGHYDITVWATDMSGNVASNETGIDITPNGAGGMPAPQSVSVSSTDGLVDVTWSPVAWPNLAGYYVYRGNRSTPPFERLTSLPLSPSAPTQYRDTTAKTGQTYYYTVTAVDTTGAESAYGPIYSVT